MIRPFKNLSKKAGLSPGVLVHVGEKKMDTVRVRVITYDKDNIQETEVTSVEELLPFLGTSTTTWINIDGIHDTSILEKLGSSFGLHPLVIEDILNTEQRPKMDDFGDYALLVLKMICLDKDNQIVTDHVSIILGQNFVMSFQEREGNIFDPVRNRVRATNGRLRQMGPDYLCYALLDTIVDNYFRIMEVLGEKIELLEVELLESPTKETLQVMHKLKREIIFLRRSVWPLREVVGFLERGESALIRKSTQVFLRDVYDHTIQVMDAIETFRDMISGMLDIYLSSSSNKLNEVMKVLTIIATIFIPLTFIVGVYGMNFKHMPELDWRLGYFVIWAMMIIIAVFMIMYFKKKRWL